MKVRCSSLAFGRAYSVETAIDNDFALFKLTYLLARGDTWSYGTRAEQ